MALPPDVERRLDEEAALARAEFEQHWQTWTVVDVAEWWDRWCQMDGTNHDRLGKILVNVTGVKARARGSWIETDE
jgi:hypothetical protein